MTTTAVSLSIVAAYGATGAAWQAGPGQIYDELARAVVGLSPVPLAGRLVLDLGAGTGAGSRAIVSVGAHALGLDAAHGMLMVSRPDRPPAVQGDALALPFADAAFGAVVAPFSLNHVTDPVAALREAARVTEAGGAVLASTYASDDTHPVKGAVEAALGEIGWHPPDWYHDLRHDIIPLLASTDRCQSAADAAGLRARVAEMRVAFSELAVGDLVGWRLGMAAHAPFVQSLSIAERDALCQRAIALLGDTPPTLVRSFLVIVATT